MIINSEQGRNKEKDYNFNKFDGDNSMIINDGLFTMENGAHGKIGEEKYKTHESATKEAPATGQTCTSSKTPLHYITKQSCDATPTATLT